LNYIYYVKNKLQYVKKDDTAKYLNKAFNVAIEKSASKQNILDIAFEYLTEENAINFIKEFNKDITYSSNEVKEILDITDYRLKKLVADGKIEIVGTYKSVNGKGNLYSIIDVWNCKGCISCKKKPKLREFETSDENISDALYLINKSAKVSRDTKNEKTRTNIGKASRTRMNNLYDLKDAVISKLIKESRIEIIGIHNKEYNATERIYKYFNLYSDEEINEQDTFYMGKDEFYSKYITKKVIKTHQLLFFRLKDNTFHIPYEGGCNNYPVLNKVIKEDISALKTKKVDMTLPEAKVLLENYILMKVK
jgi:hypothetical protein